MWQSLNRLAALDGDTLVYPGHDYTVANYEFSLSIEPGNTDVQKQLDEIKAGGTGCPSTIEQERLTNIFLRANDDFVRSAMNMPDCPAEDVFAAFRRAKDSF